MGILEAANIEHWCAICNKLASQRHHLYPKCANVRTSNGTGEEVKKWISTIWVCRKCHRQIHHLFSNWELAETFNYADALKFEIGRRLKDAL